MATKKKMLQAAAGGAGGAGLDITDVFSTYLYEGNNNGASSGPNPTRKITNGINLLDEGGLVWLKDRDTNPYSGSHWLMDSERSTFQPSLSSDNSDAQSNQGTAIINSVQDDGFTLGYSGYTNYTGHNHASFTFRKAPKFFDVVTYTGTGSTQNISHNLGAVPALMMVKSLSSGSRWNVYHKDASPTGNPQNGRMALNTTDAWAEAPGVSVFAGLWNQTAPTDSVFTVGSYNDTNASGENFVAYIFAHNNSDGEFGPDADQDIIKCGSFSVNSSYEADVDIGFEPQFVMIKPAADAASWMIFDTMRGAPVGGDTAWLAPDLSQQEVNTANRFWPTATGFHIGNYGITAGNDIIYMAIRRGPLAPPEAGTEVFHALTRSGNNTATEVTGVGFPVDLLIANSRTGGYYPGWTYDRLRGEPYLLTPSNGAEVAGASTSVTLAGYMDGYLLPTSNPNRSVSSGYFDYAWKRAPSFFDVVAYTGDGTAGRTVPHNLGVAPEMMWVKNRISNGFFLVLHSALPSSNLWLSQTSTPSGLSGSWQVSADDITFNTALNNTGFNASGSTFIAYLFATLAGVSKVSSYTGNGSSQTINAGFTSGARFILIRRTDSTGDWYVWDTARGIVAGNDPHMSLNTTADEVTSDDSIDPDSSGFIVNQIAATNINVSSATYIYYAVA